MRVHTYNKYVASLARRQTTSRCLSCARRTRIVGITQCLVLVISEAIFFFRVCPVSGANIIQSRNNNPNNNNNNNNTR